MTAALYRQSAHDGAVSPRARFPRSWFSTTVSTIAASHSTALTARIAQRSIRAQWQVSLARYWLLRGAGLLASEPRSPTPGAPHTYVTTKHFLSAFGTDTLRDLPDVEVLEDAGLLSRKFSQRRIAICP